MTAKVSQAPALPDILQGVQIGRYEWRPLPDGVVWSPELMSIYGVTHAPKYEAEFCALVHADDRTRVEGETSAYLGSDVLNYSHTFRIQRPDGRIRLILDRAVIERDAMGKAEVVRGVNIDITDDAHLFVDIEDRISASEGRYQKLFNAIDQGFCVVEVLLEGPGGQIDYRVIEANPAFYDRTGFPTEIFGAWLREAAPGLEEHWFQTYGQVAQTGIPVKLENRSDHLRRWFDVCAFPIDLPGSNRVAILFSDITERKGQEAQTHAMVDEINHRSKNMLGIIQAMARQSVIGGPEGFLDRFGKRVRALAASNDLLAKNGWRAVSLHELIRSQLMPFAGQSALRVSLTGPDVGLVSGVTRTLGMAFHELATNAAKYGALANPEGKIRVDWSISSDPQSGRQFLLNWVEEGGPAVIQPLRKGFGSKVTKQMVEVNTQGQVTVDYAPTGLSWQLVAPADTILDGAAPPA